MQEEAWPREAHYQLIIHQLKKQTISSFQTALRLVNGLSWRLLCDVLAVYDHG